MKQYKAVFFDWDGTAVLSRTAPVDDVVLAMQGLLQQGVKLCIISGTTYNRIAGGTLAERFSPIQRRNLFLGLARGAHDFGFDEAGQLFSLHPTSPTAAQLELLHRVCFEVHLQLLQKYGFNTDIVFDRPNYCKLDLLCGVDRGEHLYFQASETQMLEQRLKACGFAGGLHGLITLAEEISGKMRCPLKATTDAKYLEIGFTTKSNNVNFLLKYLDLAAEDCCFWGDEFLEIGSNVFGSDAQMITHATANGEFFDISDIQGLRPAPVQQVGGGVECFVNFLKQQREEQQ